jgi:hypothetical protein
MLNIEINLHLNMSELRSLPKKTSHTFSFPSSCSFLDGLLRSLRVVLECCDVTSEIRLLEIHGHQPVTELSCLNFQLGVTKQFKRAEVGFELLPGIVVVLRCTLPFVGHPVEDNLFQNFGITESAYEPRRVIGGFCLKFNFRVIQTAYGMYFDSCSPWTC